MNSDKPQAKNDKSTNIELGEIAPKQADTVEAETPDDNFSDTPDQELEEIRGKLNSQAIIKPESEASEKAEPVAEEKDLISTYFEKKIGRNFDKLNPEEKKAIVGKYNLKFAGKSQGLKITATDCVLADSFKQADCNIEISEQVFKDLTAGSLNPQIAMLSGDIKFSGKVNLAMYFFKLI